MAKGEEGRRFKLCGTAEAMSPVVGLPLISAGRLAGRPSILPKTTPKTNRQMLTPLVWLPSVFLETHAC